jgi:hypothetical protein
MLLGIRDRAERSPVSPSVAEAAAAPAVPA